MLFHGSALALPVVFNQEGLSVNSSKGTSSEPAAHNQQHPVKGFDLSVLGAFLMCINVRFKFPGFARKGKSPFMPSTTNLKVVPPIEMPWKYADHRFCITCMRKTWKVLGSSR